MKPPFPTLLLLLLGLSGTARGQVPLPADLAIIPPAPDVPAADAALSGLSTGPMLERSDRNIPTDMQIDSAVEDLNTVVDAMRAEPWVDPQRIIVAGQSRGGLLVVAYAGRYPDKVEGVINFSGGWWAGRGWGAPINTAQFAAAGQHSKALELWLYADGDSYYTLAHDRTNSTHSSPMVASANFIPSRVSPAMATP